MKTRFALPVFLGSALLFCVEPMLGRTLLPLFGGAACVWTTCLVAYQALLLAGALYADRVARAPFRRQRAVHIALLALAAAWALAFSLRRASLEALAPEGDGVWEASRAALLCVFAAIGLPFAVLGAGSSLLQKWAAESLGEGRETYRLYAVSAIGSFAGLLLHPLVLEPFVSQAWQWRGLAAGLALYGLLCAFAARAGRAAAVAPEPQGRPGAGRLRTLLWLALPALSTALLNATTAHLSMDVTPVPLMWAVLLGAFLLSYSIGFARWGERLLPAWNLLAAAAVVYAIWALRTCGAPGRDFLRNFASGTLVVLFGGSLLHAWLCRARPGEGLLTRYYLCIAAGGALGGVASGVLPPLLFPSAAEYPIALLLLLAAALLAPLFAPEPWLPAALRLFGYAAPPPAKAAATVAVALLLGAVAVRARTASRFSRVYERGRTFHGCWMVVRDVITLRGIVPEGFQEPRYGVTALVNGTTSHGLEPETDALRTTATAYYGPQGGGLAFTLHPKYAQTNAPMRVGIVGMGAGTQAWYGRAGDLVRFFELDGVVAEKGREWFSFVPKSAAQVEVVVGDARRALVREQDAVAGKYDVLVVDAFNGDAIPFHLLTRQAFDLYADRLAPGGILALHITNWHVDLLPVCKAAMRHLGWQGLAVASKGGVFIWDALWVFLSERELPRPSLSRAGFLDWGEVRDLPLPDDEKGSILPFLRLWQKKGE